MVSFLILLTVITNLLPKKAYEAYFRLFTGILFLFLLLKPFMELSGMESQVVAAFRQITLQNEAEWLKEEIEQADSRRMERLEQQYQEMMERELDAKEELKKE